MVPALKESHWQRKTQKITITVCDIKRAIWFFQDWWEGVWRMGTLQEVVIELNLKIGKCITGRCDSMDYWKGTKQHVTRDTLILKKHSLFVWNSNLTRCPVFIFSKPGNSLHELNTFLCCWNVKSKSGVVKNRAGKVGTCQIMKN